MTVVKTGMRDVASLRRALAVGTCLTGLTVVLCFLIAAHASTSSPRVAILPVNDHGGQDKDSTLFGPIFILAAWFFMLLYQVSFGWKRLIAKSIKSEENGESGWTPETLDKAIRIVSYGTIGANAFVLFGVVRNSLLAIKFTQ